MSSQFPSKPIKPKLTDEMFLQEFREALYNSQQYLLGEILTIIDACASDEVQRKAIKDLVRNRFQETGSKASYRWLEWVQEQFAITTEHTESSRV